MKTLPATLANIADVLRETREHKIELRSIKHLKRASEETECFEADIYADGVQVGIVTNDGHGGCHRYHPINLSQALDAYAKTLPRYADHDFEAGDALINDLFCQWQITGDVRRDLAKALVFTKADGHIYTIKPPKGSSLTVSTLIAHHAKYAPSAVLILNSLPIEEAVQIYWQAARP